MAKRFSKLPSEILKLSDEVVALGFDIYCSEKCAIYEYEKEAATLKFNASIMGAKFEDEADESYDNDVAGYVKRWNEKNQNIPEIW